MTELKEILGTSSIIGEQDIIFYPVTPITYGDPILLEIPETLTQLTDPHFLLRITCKIVEGDGSVLKDAAVVAPTNLALHSIFRDVILKANGIIMNQASGTYSYKAYIETVYTYSSTAKNGAIGIPQMFYKETPEKFNTITLGENSSLDSRIKKFAKAAEVDMIGRLHVNLCLQNNLIIPGINFSVTLIPSPTQFHIFSGTAAAAEKLVITKISLKIRRINISSQCVLNIERTLQRKSFHYPIRHSVVRTAHISAGQSAISNFILSNGQVPRCVIITFVEAASCQGVYSRNPYIFNLKNCLSAQIAVDGRLIPSIAFTPKTSMIEPYLATLKMVHKLFTDSDTGITYDDYLGSGYQILAFDLFPHEAGTPARTNGVVTFNGQWSPTSFDDNYLMLYYLLYDNTISIDDRRNIILDYIP